MNLKIKATNLELTPALKEYAEEKVGMLEKYYDQIIEVRVEIGLISKHHQKGKIYRAEFNVRVPGKLLRVEKTTEDLYKAIDKVKDHMVLELKKYKEKRRDKSRQSNKR